VQNAPTQNRQIQNGQIQNAVYAAQHYRPSANASSIAPASASPAPADAQRMAPGIARPVILLLAQETQLSRLLVAVCSGLDLDCARIDSDAEIGAALHRLRPIGFACATPPTGAMAACDIVKTISRYRPGLPLLIQTDDDPETLGCLDAVMALCGATEVQLLTAPPRLDDVLAFVARAGRRSGRFGLMQV
jgi:hypothetical protein